MYGLDVKKVENKRRGSSVKRSSSPNIQRKEVLAGKFLKAGQPNIYQTVPCKAGQERPNRTGLPDTLKTGIENLSGISMDDVRVHYNSSKPAQLQALAYTKGTDIHIAPGQTKHLPHEAWHVVQQKQGRVMPTMRFGGDLINDNPALEREADCMGAKAVQGKFQDGAVSVKHAISTCVQRQMPGAFVFSEKYLVDKYNNYFVNRGSTMTMSTPLSAENKVGALQKISEEAADIGSFVKNSQMTDSEFFYAVIKAKYKTNTQMKKETDVSTYESQIDELDENIYAEPYMKDGYREGWEEDIRKLEGELNKISLVTLSLKYQFRKSGVHLRRNEVGGPGYIVSVEKTRQRDGITTGNMVNPGRGRRINTANSYSNSHESTQGSILGHTYKKSNAEGQKTGIRSKNFDAYTKLAGEGARFQCVRRNIATITDETVIHAPGKSRGVKFSELWLTWSASFDKKYNIKDNEIAQKLMDRRHNKPINTLWIKQYDRYTQAVLVNGNDHIELEN